MNSTAPVPENDRLLLLPEIAAEMRRVVLVLKEGGGYIFSSDFSVIQFMFHIGRAVVR